MKYSVLFFLLHIICNGGFGQNKSSSGYTVPDSIKAAGFYAEIKITESSKSKKKGAGITTNGISVLMGYNKEQKIFLFNYFAKPGEYIVYGNGTDRIGHAITWNYNWKENETYPLLIAIASDSAANKTLYSGYVYLPGEKKWKLIGTRSYNDTVGLKYLGKLSPKNSASVFSNRWLMRNNGSWKALDSQTTKPPSLRHMSNIDSFYQQKIEEDSLRARLPKDSITYKEGIFYQPIKEGSGRPVNVTDTVVIYYKGWLFSNGSIFDETKEKPATFPLNRLIKGWQLGLPQCRVSGKIRLYIPSGSAYGIRTFATDIPPNSTLVFDVEVLEAKEKIKN